MKKKNIINLLSQKKIKDLKLINKWNKKENLLKKKSKIILK